jgi:hypothetical protein
LYYYSLSCLVLTCLDFAAVAAVAAVAAAVIID